MDALTLTGDSGMKIEVRQSFGELVVLEEATPAVAKQQTLAQAARAR